MSSRVNRRDFLKGSAAGASALATGLGGARNLTAGAAQAKGGKRETHSPAERAASLTQPVSLPVQEWGEDFGNARKLW